MCVYVHTHICTCTSGCFSSEHAPQSYLPRLIYQTTPSNHARLTGPQSRPPKNEPFPRTLPLPSAWARLSRSMFSTGARTKVTVTCTPGSGRGPSQKLLKSSWNKPNFPHWLCLLSNSTGRSLSKGSSPHPVPHPAPPLPPKNSTIATLREELPEENAGFLRSDRACKVGPA